MKKYYLQRLALIITEKCNLDCAHCVRGKKCNKDISDEIIEKTFEQVDLVGCVAINGGEPTLVIDKIEKIIDSIIKRQIKLEQFTITINGTIYSEELLRLLDEIDRYIGDDTVSSLFAISLDNYHIDEMKKLGILENFIDNYKRYKKSKHFYGTREIDFKLFREGNAENLDESITVPLRPMQQYVSYVDSKRYGDVCCIGPLVTVNVDGIVTECDASNVNQRSIYNYGNILDDSIENIVLSNGALVVPYKKYEKITYKTLKKYWSYNE